MRTNHTKEAERQQTDRPWRPQLPWFCNNCKKVTNPGYRDTCQLCGAPEENGYSQ